ncbi:MAG: Zn-dependent hydrolase, partial [Gammaproteobacteria bacterium]|nr:Zn-dependent hydrolase [Gammaproteobacteria bacterium]
FSDAGAFSRDPDKGTYRVNVAEFETAVKNLGKDILILQGNGDYDAVAELVAEYGTVGEQLQADLNRLDALSIPVDIVYQQGKQELGL